jgi:hypothetical protein
MKNAARAQQAPEPERRLRTEMYLANQASAVVAGSSLSVIAHRRSAPRRSCLGHTAGRMSTSSPTRAINADSMRGELYRPDRPIIAVVGRVQSSPTRNLRSAFLPSPCTAGSPPGARGGGEATLRRRATRHPSCRSPPSWACSWRQRDSPGVVAERLADPPPSPRSLSYRPIRDLSGWSRWNPQRVARR